MPDHLPVVIGADAIGELVSFCRTRGLTRFALIADANTVHALGHRVTAALQTQGYDVLTILLQGDDIGADERAVYQVLLGLDKAPRTFLSVGSGTITDVTRFVSHRSNADFIALPTAPSVDGFTSIGAPMIIDGVKITVPCQGPLAIFADLPTLTAAPKPMIAAGLGDMIAKLTSVADWELGHLLWDESFDAAIAARARAAAWSCAQRIGAIAAGEAKGIQTLIAGLIESGFCMLDFGATALASGFEHHISHYLEMMLLNQGRHSILHGAKVGLGVLISATRYQALAALSRTEAGERLSRYRLPDRSTEIAAIRTAFPAAAERIIAIQAPFLEMTGANLEALKQRIITHWDDIQQIAAAVPPAAQFETWLRSVEGATRAAELGFSDAELAEAVAAAPYYRNRFTIGKLSHLLELA